MTPAHGGRGKGVIDGIRRSRRLGGDAGNGGQHRLLSPLYNPARQRNDGSLTSAGPDHGEGMAHAGPRLSREGARNKAGCPVSPI